MKTFRITIQEVNPGGTLGQLAEIIETERETWDGVFVFVDEYRKEVAEENERENLNTPGLK